MSGLILPGAATPKLNLKDEKAMMSPEMQRIMAAAEETHFLKQEIQGMQRMLVAMAWKYAGGKAIIEDTLFEEMPNNIHVLRDENNKRVLLWASTEPLTPEDIMAEATTEPEEPTDEGS
jgi:hypothetical protein